LKHYLVKIKDSGRHSVEYTQNILTNDSEKSLSKLDHYCTLKKILANNLSITYHNSNMKVPVILTEYLSILNGNQ